MGSKPIDQLLETLEYSHVTFPYLLLVHYKSLGVTEQEAMLLLHILAYQQMEGRFPDLDVLTERMGLTKEQIAISLQRFTLSGLIFQDKQRLSIRPLIEQMIGLREHTSNRLSIFSSFENEFGRLLSPLEQEQIASWLDDDKYPLWMIVEALRESVLSGVYKLRYVDTVLREWARARIKTESQLAEHRSQHRGRGAIATESRTRASSSVPNKNRTEQQGKEQDQSARVLPAAQPGKYERFYQLYKSREEASAANDHT